ncbi:pentapeptide repeat-containing protein [uncultured Rikenella sp.]|uniref:pentapeptide repeat-containing protein n=2 Tax=uncultured Rikenella sp. TaxID=368003 RepID=UPI0026117091|nr:pentapeptide repeat-containing protein [uncultured Rikenella sp.]
MPTAMIYDKVLHKICGAEALPGREFEGCIFRECDFTGARFSDFDFTECRFEKCRFGMAEFEETGMREAVFEECEVRGVDFGRCRKFGFSVAFRKCHLSFCSFHGLKMPKTAFTEGAAKECFFSECDLTQADFSGCDLERTLFDGCKLEKADFRTAFQYTIDPAINRMRGARFSRDGLEGLLASYGLSIE